MTYYKLPSIQEKLLQSQLKIRFDQYEKGVYAPICNSMSRYLLQVKNEIENHYNLWDNFKKYTNPYEFIHTPIPSLNLSVSKYKPISRAFFKLVEIYNTHKIIKTDRPIKTFHLAEGPGGFIEATAVIRANKNDRYYGITLIDKDSSNVPGWNKSKHFLEKYKNVTIENGVDKTGNLYNYENFFYLHKKYGNTMDIITGDGGFDFSVDYNKQENNAYFLLFTQICYALILQKRGGTFILKIFDIFKYKTVELLYMLSCFYKEVYIMKPYTSRYANSEKYVICKHFKYSNVDYLTTKIGAMLKLFKSIQNNPEYNLVSILDLEIHSYYINSIKNINIVLGSQQIENILYTIKLISMKDKKRDKIEAIKTNNIKKCIFWCSKNNISYNSLENKNSFLADK